MIPSPSLLACKLTFFLPPSLPPSLPPPLPPSLPQSPAHTARLKLLHELFPEAKFIHISRNPFEVYQSTSKLFMDLLIQVRPPSLPAFFVPECLDVI